MKFLQRRRRQRRPLTHRRTRRSGASWARTSPCTSATCSFLCGNQILARLQARSTWRGRFITARRSRAADSLVYLCTGSTLRTSTGPWQRPQRIQPRARRRRKGGAGGCASRHDGASIAWGRGDGVTARRWRDDASMASRWLHVAPRRRLTPSPRRGERHKRTRHSPLETQVLGLQGQRPARPVKRGRECLFRFAHLRLLRRRSEGHDAAAAHPPGLQI